MYNKKHTSHRPSNEPSVEAIPSRSLDAGEVSFLTLELVVNLYNLSSSCTKCDSNSPLLTVTPHTGQHEGSVFFFPVSSEEVNRLFKVNALREYEKACSAIATRTH